LPAKCLRRGYYTEYITSIVTKQPDYKTGDRAEYIFLKQIFIWPALYEKMLKVISHHGNTDQKHAGISPHLVKKNSFYQKEE
jgi:hypothetical protein